MLANQLDDAEVETLRLLADGKNSGQIAAERSLARRTVETQLKNIYKKMGVSSASEAVARAHHEGLLPH